MYRDLLSREPKLRLAYEFLEGGNLKRALSETNKILKKNPKSQTANALKSLVLLRNSKVIEGCQLMDSVMKDFPTDTGTLNIMQNFFKEVNRGNEMLEYLKLASDKFPDNDELQLYLFFSHVRNCDFDSQQLVARKMLRKNPNNKQLFFWTVLSTIMQGEKDPTLAERIFLPLAQRMLEKAFNGGLYETHIDLQLYIDTLKRLKMYQAAIDILNNETLINLLNSKDYSHDYSNEMLHLNSELNIWPELVRISNTILQTDSDDWSAWRIILKHTFTSQESTFNPESRLNETESMIKSFVALNPKQRGPSLAYLDFAANVVQRGINYPSVNESFRKQLIRNYFNQFGSRPICALDIAHLIPLLLPDTADRIPFLESILKEASSTALSSPPLDRDATHRHVCAYRIARTNGVPVDLTDLLRAYQFHDISSITEIAIEVDKLKIGDSSNSNEKKIKNKSEQGVGDMLPSDGLLFLAVSELLEKNLSSPKQDRLHLGRMVLVAHWLDSIGLHCSPENHFMRLRLAHLLSSGGGLNCVDRQLKELKKLELKQLLLTALGHLAVVSGPQLTIWGHTDPQTPLLPQPSPNNSSESPNQQVDVSAISTPTTAMNLSQFYEHIIKKTTMMISESEDWLVGAYRQHTYTQVREFGQFLNQLRHADIVIAARSDLLYRKMLVLPNSFDEVLENMGSVSPEISSTKALLEGIIDCRDFTTIPEFNPYPQNMQNQLDTFSHSKLWSALRLNVIELFGLCSKLIMKLVVRIECLNVPPSSRIQPVSTEETDALQNVKNKADFIFTTAPTSTIDFSKFRFNDLLLASENLCMSPPPLPNISMANFYYFGPFGSTLKAYLLLLSTVSEALEKDPDTPFEALNPIILENIVKPIHYMLEDYPNSTCALLPPPPTDMHHKETLLHPGAILLGMGTAVETVSLAILSISSVISMLRPRRFAHQPFSVNLKKKQKHKSIESSITDEFNPKTHSPLACFFDQLAIQLHSRALPILERAIDKLVSLSEEWAHWSNTQCVNYLVASASTLADLIIPDMVTENFQWRPNTDSTIIKEITADYFTGFCELASICSKKLSALESMKNELHFFTTLNTVQI